MTTLDDFGGVLERPLDTFIWAFTISWSRLLARVQSPTLGAHTHAYAHAHGFWVGMGGYCVRVGMDGHSFQVGT